MYITGCIITTGCSIAVALLIDTWNIGWNCLGGGIQYLLPTMIEPHDSVICAFSHLTLSWVSTDENTGCSDFHLQIRRSACTGHSESGGFTVVCVCR